ncbi:1,4-dihydroxy-2-naphthoate prenyltransferase [Actinokineospora alba]|uniref:1,4-dihydroxy-2-naphthoate octaprenyltransferase n=1 Tax=Actinokineospora alba TaxID=504798 RepID=A0A1H0VD05_9PSEU|nr:1,4-dihydroxy-2-naphthoate polyprenyltransferase [Actinokineospora alba]TDP65648.1 1,4-dihydroxy-2-naphthoate prenyltransferase [Actinokineospora alba]SDH67494.1 1,4-dihydroxy-2-naphthoate octaprenyltransferase [Actinokineospora alba]SDP76357.1 1,4-dihydroxy-2-naphthoate prenyltransferase [Actinokineospora alba]
MATVAEWVQGARVRTLPNSVAPVLVGAGAAAALDGFSWWKSLLALVVALSLQVGVNYANDYSDGVRGTDDNRVGPLRLVGSGVATPSSVKLAAFACFGIGAVAGLVLVIASRQWWLLGVGALCIAGAWFYTGGSKPYGYSGFGEVAVFLFFGLVAVLGTQYIQAGTVSWTGLACAVSMGTFSAAVLVANNLRDVPTDRVAGKTTLAVRLGEPRTRVLYAILVAIPFLISIVQVIQTPAALAGLLAAVLIVAPLKLVLGKATGPALIPVLKQTGLAMLAWAVITALAVGLS